MIMPPYMDIHLSNALRKVTGQLRTSSQQLEIEVGRYAQIPLEIKFANCLSKEWNSKNTMLGLTLSNRTEPNRSRLLMQRKTENPKNRRCNNKHSRNRGKHSEMPVATL